ncbi:MAG: hypothetical protein LC772_03045, partial [Chloroflexi bacterium]|nr:hypothetical protein [Chloroflexota bacterium]
AMAERLESFVESLPQLLVVSTVEIVGDSAESGVVIEVTRAEGQKCARCWNVLPDVGAESSFPLVCVKCARTLAELDVRRQR